MKEALHKEVNQFYTNVCSAQHFTVTAMERGDKYGKLHNCLSKLERSPSPRLIHPRFHWDGQGMLGTDFLLSWKLVWWRFCTHGSL